MCARLPYLSCFVWLKSVLFNLLCVFHHRSNYWCKNCLARAWMAHSNLLPRSSYPETTDERLIRNYWRVEHCTTDEWLTRNYQSRRVIANSWLRVPVDYGCKLITGVSWLRRYKSQTIHEWVTSHYRWINCLRLSMNRLPQAVDEWVTLTRWMDHLILVINSLLINGSPKTIHEGITTT